MAKGILKFNLPGEKEEFDIACNAQNLYGIIWDLNQEIKSKLKHGNNFKTPDEALEFVREYLLEVKLDFI